MFSKEQKGERVPLFPLPLILEYFTQERYISRKVEKKSLKYQYIIVQIEF